jgi:hypothetical protein
MFSSWICVSRSADDARDDRRRHPASATWALPTQRTLPTREASARWLTGNNSKHDVARTTKLAGAPAQSSESAQRQTTGAPAHCSLTHATHAPVTSARSPARIARALFFFCTCGNARLAGVESSTDGLSRASRARCSACSRWASRMPRRLTSRCMSVRFTFHNQSCARTALWGRVAVSDVHPTPRTNVPGPEFARCRTKLRWRLNRVLT